MKSRKEAVRSNKDLRPVEPEALHPCFVEAEKLIRQLAEISQKTAQRAFELFVERGGGFSRPHDDWFRAEAELLCPVPVEITENNGTVNVRANVAGFKPEEIEIGITDNLLLISGKTETHTETVDTNIVYSDFRSDRFFRQIPLPTAVSPEKAEAEIKDGILWIALPKTAAEPEPKRIAASAAG